MLSVNQSDASIYLVPTELSYLQFIDQPLELVGRVGGVEEEPEVLVHAIVHVETDHSQTRRHIERVVGSCSLVEN